MGVKGGRGYYGFKVIPDIMNDVLSPQGRYPENFMLISQWEVCQRRVKKGYLEDIEGS